VTLNMQEASPVTLSELDSREMTHPTTSCCGVLWVGGHRLAYGPHHPQSSTFLFLPVPLLKLLCEVDVKLPGRFLNA
jgi:hypothetical protein